MIDREKPHLKAFLCHASGDKPEVLQLYKRLVAEGIDAWLDKEKLLPGQDWRLEIPRAVRAADVVVICLSKKSVTKEGYIQKEIQFALDIAEEKPEGTIFLIPARLEDCVVPERLSRWQWVELFEEGGFLRLLRSLKLRAEKVGAMVGPLQYENEDEDTQRRLNQLYTEGLAALYTSDWDKACHRFQTILSEQPNHKTAAIKLAEAERQKSLAMLYARATEAYKAENWSGTVEVLDELLQKSSDYKDAARLHKIAKKQQRLTELYAEAKTLHDAQKWQAVLNAFEQISAIEPAYPDPENLLSSAQKEVAELRRLEKLNDLYSQAVYEIDGGHWHEAREKLELIHKSELGFLETEHLLRKVEDEIAIADERIERKKQIDILYEQAHGYLRSKSWRKALEKIDEIQNLDEQFVDVDGIAEAANAQLRVEEQENARRNELAALYTDAVQFVKAEKYQEALEKWAEIHAKDSNFPDRQKVQETAKRALRKVPRNAPHRPSPSKRTLAIVGGSVLLAMALTIGFLMRSQNSSLISPIAVVTHTPSKTPTKNTPLTSPLINQATSVLVVTKTPTQLLPSATPVPSEALIATGILQIGQGLLSSDHRYSFRFQLDGDLVVYDHVAGRLLWSSKTKGSQADRLVMQNDGNLVLITKDGSPVWATMKTSTQGDYFLLMQNDGNLVVYQGRLYTGIDVPIWATGTNQ